MFIKVLYVVLVLCTIALVGAVGAAYLKIRKHMRESEKTTKNAARGQYQYRKAVRKLGLKKWLVLPFRQLSRIDRCRFRGKWH